MAWECVKNGYELADVRKDRWKSKHVEKYSVSGQAVYFEGKYLPVSLIKTVRCQPSLYNPGGCCGRGIPVFKVRIDYGEEAPLVLMVEKEANAEKMAELICAANPAVKREEYVDPTAVDDLEQDNKQEDTMKLFKKDIDSFESVMLHISGMRHIYNIGVAPEGETARITLYDIRYEDHDHVLVPRQSATVPTEEFLDVLEKCNVLAWDGFNGPHPKGVLDGRMFRFDATVNGGETIHATGSQNFPRHFREFEDYLNEKLREAEEKNRG